MRVAIAALMIGSSAGWQIEDRPVTTKASPVWLTGKAFERDLDLPLAASWKNVPLRPMLGAIAQQRRMAILLDRRIDPTQIVAFDVNRDSLGQSLLQLAATIGAQASAAGNTIYIGARGKCRPPPHSCLFAE